MDITYTFPDKKTAHRTYAALSDDQLDINLDKSRQATNMWCKLKGHAVEWHNVKETDIPKLDKFMCYLTKDWTKV